MSSRTSSQSKRTIQPVEYPQAGGRKSRWIFRVRPRLSALLQALSGVWVMVHSGAAAALDAGALPAGGVVKTGTGIITQSGMQMTVQQSSSRLGIDWQSFNIGSNAGVNFVQPGSDSIALNRVVSNSGSEIYGRLSSNGQVFLVNPNGILFAPSAKLDVGGLVASTLDLSQEDFAGARYNFAGNGGKVLNQGTLIAAPAGYVALLGRDVGNEGSIQAQTGSVLLASGRAATLDIAGGGLISAVVSPGMAGSIRNSGQILADGGVITLSARSAEGLASSLVNNTGLIRANALVQKHGEIWIEADGVNAAGLIQAQSGAAGSGSIVLNGGATGIVAVTGTLDASGTASGQSGGSIKVLGDKVGFIGSATADASGDVGAGTVLIGGNLQGRGPEQNATRTFIDTAASIKADATGSGNGGKVIVWSSGVTDVHGSISAAGGPQGGDGGFVETSGHVLGAAGASVSTVARAGHTGTWLLDPTNINVVASGSADASTLTFGPGGTGLWYATPGLTAGDSNLDVALINNPSTNVVLQAANNVNFNTSVSVSQWGLTAQAGNNINFGANNIIAGGPIAFMANSSAVGYPASGSGSISGSGTIKSFSGITLMASGAGSITVGTLDTTPLPNSPGQAGQNGRDISVQTSGGNITIGSIYTMGSASLTDLNNTGGNGGNVLVQNFNGSTNSAISIGNIDASGGAGFDSILVNGSRGAGGNGGNVSINGTGLSSAVVGSIATAGGAGGSNSQPTGFYVGALGGWAGAIQLVSGGNITVLGDLGAAGGAGGNVVSPSAAGGLGGIGGNIDVTSVWGSVQLNGTRIDTRGGQPGLGGASTGNLGSGHLLVSAGTDIAVGSAITTDFAPIVLGSGSSALSRGTVSFNGGSITGGGTVVIYYDPIAFSAPTDYTLYCSGSYVVPYMWLRPDNNTGSVLPRPFDGTTNATLSTPFALVSAPDGHSIGQRVNLVVGSSSFNSPHAGNATSVTVSGYGLIGPDAYLYSLHNQPSFVGMVPVGSFITPRPLTATGVINAVSKQYDGLLRAYGSSVSGWQLFNVVGTDQIGLNASNLILNFNDAHVATPNKTISASGLLLVGGVTSSGSGVRDGSDSANLAPSWSSDYQNSIVYTIPSVAGTLLQRQLVASAAINGQTKTYDGLLGATGSTVNASVTGLVGSDALSINTSGISLTYSDAHVATLNKTISASGALVFGALTSTGGAVLHDGSGTNNYVISSQSDYAFPVMQPTIASVNGTIAPAPVTASATIIAAPKIYDGTIAAVGSVVQGSVTGLVGSDSMVLDVSGVGLHFSDAHVATVGKTIQATGTANMGALTSTGSGLHDGSPGNYVVSAPGDYSMPIAPVVAAVPGVITPKVVTATATISGASKVYDGTVVAIGSSIEGSVSGLVGGDSMTLDVSGVNLVFSDAHVATPGKTISANGTLALGGLQSSGSGNRDGSNGANLVASAPSDYILPSTPSIDSVAGTITPKVVTASASIVAAPKTYDGTLAATGSTVTGTVSGLVGSDSLTLDSSRVALEFSDAHVATPGKQISATGRVTLGGLVSAGSGSRDGSNGANLVVSALSDYDLPSAPSIASVAGMINPRTLSASAVINAVPKTYDGTLVAAGSSVSGTVSGLIGTDSMVLDTSGLSLNYSDANVATLGKTISASGTVSFGPLVSKGSGAHDGSSSANFVVSAPGDYLMPGAPFIASVAGSITPRPLYVMADNYVRLANESNPVSFTFSTNPGGLVAGDNLSAVSIDVPNASATADGGYVFALTPSAAKFGSGSATNYAISYIDGRLLILPQPPLAGVSGAQGLDLTQVVNVNQTELDNTSQELRRQQSLQGLSDCEDGVSSTTRPSCSFQRFSSHLSSMSVAALPLIQPELDSTKFTPQTLRTLPLMSVDERLGVAPGAGSRQPVSPMH